MQRFFLEHSLARSGTRGSALFVSLLIEADAIGVAPVELVGRAGSGARVSFKGGAFSQD
jgi:hypothetical protein